jgi:7-cyano-7-deazaguanine synthase in queuosine biosynthesis
MDSFLLAHLFPDAAKVYVDVGSIYSAKEKAHLPADVMVERGINLGKWERSDAIIPGRNAFMVLAASQYGDNIMLGATAGDQSRDKDDTWANMMTGLLRYMYSGKHFDPERDMSVSLPIKDLTKAELVQQYMRAGGAMLPLRDTISCYHPEHLHCGRCKSCLRKWVALEWNRIPSGAIWASDPRDPANWVEIVKTIKGKGWRTLKEDAQTLSVLREHGIVEDAE